MIHVHDLSKWLIRVTCKIEANFLNHIPTPRISRETMLTTGCICSARDVWLQHLDWDWSESP